MASLAIRTALVLSSTVVLVFGTCDPNGYTDGCTTYGILEKYNGLFLPACTKHDTCYSCGYKRGISRSTCDRWFVNNLMNLCQKAQDKYDCYKYLLAFKVGVSLFGEDHYEEPSLKWCDEPWVQQCLGN